MQTLEARCATKIIRDSYHYQLGSPLSSNTHDGSMGGTVYFIYFRTFTIKNQLHVDIPYMDPVDLMG